MAKIMSITNPNAWIVSPKDRGRKSIKNGVVFLKDNDEFEIELYNPLSVSVLADIKLNGIDISKSGLILKPGQRVYLDCFIDDKRKFIFKTYEVENSEESMQAIQNNGSLEVFFYKEEFFQKYISNYGMIRTTGYPYFTGNINLPYNSTCSGTSISNLNSNITLTNSASSYTQNINCSYNNDNIETGRVEKGDKSSQNFQEVYMNFESYCISYTKIKILPDSQRPMEVKDIKKITINKKDERELDSVKSKSIDTIELIQKLSDLHKSGILTDEEFIDKKCELLSRI